MEQYENQQNLRDILPCVFRYLISRPERWASRFVFLLGPWASLWMVEIMNENNVFEDLDTWQVAGNLFWYYGFFVALRLILGRNRRAAGLGASVSFLIGLLNHYILRFRGRIIFPADVLAWRTAANVAQGFDYSMDRYISEAAIVLVAYLFLVFYCVPQKKRAKIPFPIGLVCWGIMAAYCYGFFFTDALPNMGIFTQQWVTQRNGFVLNFTIALRYSSVDKPEDYSEETVMSLLNEYPGEEGDESLQPDRILVVMNESFGDFSIFDSFEPSEDPLPFLHSLDENTIQGWMYSPVTGGGTATVEFEFLTGFSSLFQPPHTVAYQLYVEEDMPSLAALAGLQGYTTSAFHPYDRSGWNRVIAYDYLSFENQYYQEDVPDPYIIRHYISDLSDYMTVLKNIQDEDRSFFFNVTMQNHSGYAQGWNNLERTISIGNELSNADTSAEQYFALSRESDIALQQLLSECTKRGEQGERIMVVFFGDHQPPLNNAFYEKLFGKKLSERTTAEVLQQYAVPFFIWTNYDIEEQRDVVISPNFLGVYTAKMAGLPLTSYMQFLSELYEELPAVTPVGFVTKDGQFLEKKELSAEQQELLWKYEVLNYCGMVDLFEEARPGFCLN